MLRLGEKINFAFIVRKKMLLTNFGEGAVVWYNLFLNSGQSKLKLAVEKHFSTSVFLKVGYAHFGVNKVLGGLRSCEACVMQYTHPCGEPTMRWFRSRRRTAMLSIKLCNPLPLWLLRKLVLEIHAQRTRFACLIRLTIEPRSQPEYIQHTYKKMSQSTHAQKARCLSARRWSESFLYVHYIKSSAQKTSLYCIFFCS